ncbi:MAG: hypothetical protein A2Y79_03040 [Deltaproteobacteria bacterium RBG_13_43_22]|nr:MAG: hypothetical protein A2Y79_03040 [Deltaproteobacteria bacterium RBG_13_43_22]
MQKFFKTLAWSLGLLMLLTAFLFAEEKKTLPPAPPDTQKECDQNEPKPTSPDSSLSSPIVPAKGKNRNPDSLTPSPLKVQENTDSGG